MRTIPSPVGDFLPALEGVVAELPPEEELLGRAVVENVEHALEHITSKYSKGPDRLDYHGFSHTNRAGSTFLHLMGIMQQADPEAITDRMVVVGALAPAYHDYNKFTVVKTEGVLRGRQDRIEPVHHFVSEESSAFQAGRSMRKSNRKYGLQIFSPEDIVLVQDPIKRTIAIHESETVHQDTKDASAVGLATCLADTTACGLDPEVFLDEGNRLFRELYPVSPSTLRTIGSVACTKLCGLAIDWTHKQKKFVEGRIRFSEIEIDEANVSEAVKTALKAGFTAFESSLRQIDAQFHKRLRMNPGQLLRSVGYELPDQ